MCIFIQKYVLGSALKEVAILQAEKKAMNDDINMNNKPFANTVLSVLRVTL